LASYFSPAAVIRPQVDPLGQLRNTLETGAIDLFCRQCSDNKVNDDSSSRDNALTHEPKRGGLTKKA
jgi:hypothetical protein